MFILVGIGHGDMGTGGGVNVGSDGWGEGYIECGDACGSCFWVARRG